MKKFYEKIKFSNNTKSLKYTVVPFIKKHLNN